VLRSAGSAPAPPAEATHDHHAVLPKAAPSTWLMVLALGRIEEDELLAMEFLRTRLASGLRPVLRSAGSAPAPPAEATHDHHAVFSTEKRCNGVLADPVSTGCGASALTATVFRSRRRRGGHVSTLTGRPWVSPVPVIRHLRPLHRVTHITPALVPQLFLRTRLAPGAAPVLSRRPFFGREDGVVVMCSFCWRANTISHVDGAALGIPGAGNPSSAPTPSGHTYHLNYWQWSSCGPG
jgi:hypothetical protein